MSDEFLDRFAVGNLAAWCIVPYDGARRGPVERAEMLAELGFRHFVWDWRPEHLPTFESELDALAVEGIELDGVWFPARLGAAEPDDAGRFLLDELARRGVSTDLWVCTDFGAPGPVAELSPSEQDARVDAHARALVPAAEAARSIGGRVGLYNHLGWFGEPENQLAITDRLADLGFENVGLVYNQHHGHAHLPRFETLLERMVPRLIAFNLNGMVPEGDLTARKLLAVGHGSADGELLRSIVRVLGAAGVPDADEAAAVRAAGGRVRFGLIGHTADDARDRLLDNLEGLAWLVARLREQASEGGATSPATGPTQRPPEARIPAPVVPGW